MSKMRKVQAQRKFAQGAYIPPPANNNNLLVERNSEPHDKSASQPPILQNMTAGELLDKISFNNIHTHETHKLPIVRLERLPRVPPVRPPRLQTYVPEESVKSYTFAIPLKYRVLPRTRAKNRVLKKKNGPGPVKKNYKIVKKRIPQARRDLRLRRTNIRCLTEDTDTEDDTPLKYLVKSKNIPKKRVLPSRSVPVPARTPRTLVQLPALPSTSKGYKTPAKGNANVSPGNKNSKIPAKQAKGPTAAESGGFYSPDNIERWITAAAKSAAEQFKVPLPPRPLKRSTQTTATTIIPNRKKPSNDVNTSTLQLRLELAPSELAPSEVAPSELAPFEDSRSELAPSERAPSWCPSQDYVTVKDVVSASEQERRRRCKVCNYCSRAHKVERLSKVVQATTKGRSLDVYEFDTEREGKDPSLKGFRSCRRADNDEPIATDSNYVYLDILPSPSSHVIQIKLTPVVNQKKPMMQARLMPKNTVTSLNEYNLVEHEGLFEQLIETLDSRLLKRLNVSNPTEKRTIAGPSKPTNTTAVASKSKTEIKPVAGTSRDNGKRGTRVTKANKGRKGLATRRQTRAGPIVDENNAIAATLATGSPTRPSATSTLVEVIVEKPTTSKERSAILQNVPKADKGAVVREAPIYYPTEAEFNDPIAYFEKIMPTASKFGLCKVVAPASFKPKCTINEKIRFKVANQYIARLYTRWGPGSKEMSAIKAHLFSQSVPFTQAPILDSLEVDLPKLYRTVQHLGGLNTVIEKKLWGRVAELMRLAKKPQTVKKLDDIYVKYLLPYDTLSSQEREDIRAQVNKSWHKKNEKILQRMANPLHRQKQLLGESGSSTSDTEDEVNIASALTEAEDCIGSGSRMTLANFTKVAQAVKDQYFPDTAEPTPREVEEEYWRIVLLAAEHICVNTASIDSGDEGHGFPKSKQDAYGRHPWNPKMISQNPGNVLAMLGPVLGVTVPTLHLGMIFSTSCWHRDPHGLPWLEYMHSGPAKIWYGIPDDQSAAFRTAVEQLCPTSCQNKSIWLPSDITMIPPNFLLSSNVSLTRVEQKPGEYIIVFPKAYSSSISTGYTQSESVYFANNSWLKSVDHVFHELRDSCEPTMFSLEQLLISVARDPRAPASLLQLVHTTLATIVDDELQRRRDLAWLGLEPVAAPPRKRPAAAWNDECEVCRTTLYLSKVTGLIDSASSVCLKHALRLLTSKTNVDVTGLSLVVFFTKEQLEQIMSQLQTGICPQ